jgi:hypothetical protein
MAAAEMLATLADIEPQTKIDMMRMLVGDQQAQVLLQKAGIRTEPIAGAGRAVTGAQAWGKSWGERATEFNLDEIIGQDWTTREGAARANLLGEKLKQIVGQEMLTLGVKQAVISIEQGSVVVSEIGRAKKLSGGRTAME